MAKGKLLKEEEGRSDKRHDSTSAVKVIVRSGGRQGWNAFAEFGNF